MKAYFGSRISQNMTRTPSGFLVCHNVPIARTGWYEYIAHEIGLDGDQIVQVYRDPDEVFSPAAMASFEGAPVANDHPPEGVAPDNASVYAKGSTTNVRRGKGDDDDLLLADLIIYDQELIRAIENDKREVSAGYECNYEPNEDGTYSQTGIVGNHVAVVDSGRAGDRVRIKDAKSTPQREGVRITNEPQVRVIDSDIWVDGRVCTADAKCDQYKNEDGTFKNGFDGAVSYFKCKGYSEESAKKIAGKIAAEKAGDESPEQETSVMHWLTSKDKSKARDSRMTIKLPSRTKSRVTDLLAAVGLKHFAMDAEPDEVMDAVHAMADERDDEDEKKEDDHTEDRRAKDDGEDPTKLDQVLEALKGLGQRLDALEKGKADDEDPEKKIDDAIAQLEDPEDATDSKEDDEESETIEAHDDGEPVTPPEDRPKSGLTAADSAAAVSYLKEMKRAIAKIKDPAERKMVADAAIKAVKGRAPKPSSKSYAGIKGKKVSDSKKQNTVNVEDLGAKWRKQFNPHYKEQ